MIPPAPRIPLAIWRLATASTHGHRPSTRAIDAVLLARLRDEFGDPDLTIRLTPPGRQQHRRRAPARLALIHAVAWSRPELEAAINETAGLLTGGGRLVVVTRPHWEHGRIHDTATVALRLLRAAGLHPARRIVATHRPARHARSPHDDAPVGRVLPGPSPASVHTHVLVAAHRGATPGAGR